MHPGLSHGRLITPVTSLVGESARPSRAIANEKTNEASHAETVESNAEVKLRDVSSAPRDHENAFMAMERCFGMHNQFWEWVPAKANGTLQETISGCGVAFPVSNSPQWFGQP
jgi:hypothetical protein